MTAITKSAKERREEIASETLMSEVASKGVWLGHRIPIIGVTGAVNNGKTLAVLGIDPNCRNRSAPKTTLLYDFEGSAESYVGGLNFEWIDAAAAVRGYQLVEVFQWWRGHALGLPTGKYTIIGVDTIGDVIAGSVEYLRKHPQEFGRTQKQYNDAASMFLWPDVKALWKRLLYGEVRLRCETFAFTAHLKTKWEGSRPTKEKTPEGLDVLEKLATLYLWLDRTPPAKGKKAPRIPRGIVRKQRLVQFALDQAGDNDSPILPPCLPEASANAIRRYILVPADYDSLSPDERAPDESMSDDDKLMVQSEIASNQAAAAAANLSLAEIARAATAVQVAGLVPQQAASPAMPAPGLPAASMVAISADQSPAMPEQLEAIKTLAIEVFGSPAEAVNQLRNMNANPRTMTICQAAALMKDLSAKANAKLNREIRDQAAEDHAEQLAKAVVPANQASGEKIESVSFGPGTRVDYDQSPCRPEQATKIRELWKLYAIPVDVQQSQLSRRQAKSVEELTGHQASELAEKITVAAQKRLNQQNNDTFSDDVAAASIPFAPDPPKN